MLSPGTEYTLYAVSGTDTNGEVLPLLGFMTDAIPDTTTAPNWYSKPMGYTSTLRNGEPFLLGGWNGGKLVGNMVFADVDGDGNSRTLMTMPYDRNEGGLRSGISVAYYATSSISTPSSWIILQKAFTVGSTITDFKIKMEHGIGVDNLAPGTTFVFE